MISRVVRLVLLGPPGAGKGTQCSLIATRLGIPHISTGEMMRGALAKNDELGRMVKQYLDSGALVPDDIVTKVVKSRLSQSDCVKGFILDGYPRTLAQAQALDGLASQIGSITEVIDIEVPESLLIERIVNRGQQGSGRSDDNADVAKKRLEVYCAHTAPVSKFYQAKELLKSVNGVGSIEEVTDRILDELMMAKG